MAKSSKDAGQGDEGRRDRKRRVFTDLSIENMTFKGMCKDYDWPADKQILIWDEGQRGLALLLSPGGTKTFLSQYKLNDKWQRRTLGRHKEILNDKGEIASLNQIRDMVAEDRGKAEAGIDPRNPPLTEEQQKAKEVGPTYEAVLDDFIELWAKPRQRTWKETERVLKRAGKDWLKRPMSEITKVEAQDVIDALLKNGKGPMADVTRRWFQALWRFAWRREKYGVTEPFMDKLEVHYESRERDRVFSDEEIKAIWKAAGELAEGEGAYFKLLLLLAPRKSALAGMTASQIDDVENPSLWITPLELTKSRKTVKRRTYQTPLSPLAARILKPLLRNEGRVFGLPQQPGDKLRKKLIEKGAPTDFRYHACRHTVSTWLENNDHDEFDSGLVLNHVSTTVTAGYRHGYPLERKRELLREWSDHVEGLVVEEKA